eukprot:1848294-Pyramimonas_sp.AAC.2
MYCTAQLLGRSSEGNLDGLSGSRPLVGALRHLLRLSDALHTLSCGLQSVLRPCRRRLTKLLLHIAARSRAATPRPACAQRGRQLDRALTSPSAPARRSPEPDPQATDRQSTPPERAGDAARATLAGVLHDMHLPWPAPSPARNVGAMLRSQICQMLQMPLIVEEVRTIRLGRQASSWGASRGAIRPGQRTG